jgi:hypothetical protein
LLIVSPELWGYIARCQADAPLIVPSEFPAPPLYVIRRFLDLRVDAVELDERRWRIGVEGLGVRQADCARPVNSIGFVW